jgi:putative ABC transport system permease protein
VSLLDGIRHVSRSILGRKRVDDETREELAYHLQRQTEKHIAAGLSPGDAARLAALELGGAQRWREETAATRRGGALFDFVGDSRVATRGLVARPGFSLSAIATVAIGVGASVAIFALADGTLLRPLPFPDPARLMSVSLRMPRGQTRMDMTWSYPKFLLLRDRQRVFSALALHSAETVVLSSDDGAQRIPAEMASAELFAMLGARPMLGRTYTPAEDRIGGPSDVVVVSEGLWRSRLGARRDILGTALTIGGKKRTVIGVMPSEFRGLAGDAQLWLPVPGARSVAALEAAGAHNMELLARLNDGVSPTAAKLATEALGIQIDAAFPDVDGHWGAAAYELNALRVNPAITRSIRLLAIAVVLVLAIVCVNLGTLLLTRSAARRQELAIRAALGAERGRLIRQLMAESAELVAIGTSVGLALSWGAVRVLAMTLPLSVPTTSSGTDLTRLSFSDVGLTATSIVFALAIGALMAIGIGFAAAVRATRDGDALALRQSGGSSASGPRGFFAANGLVVAQIGLALMFLVAGGLTIQSLRRTLSIPLGYSPDHLLTVRTTLDPARATSDSNATLWRTILDELRSLPGVTVAAAGSCSPLGMRCDGTTITPNGHAPGHVAYLTVTPDYFAALETPILRGRTFNTDEMSGRRQVIMINQAAARALWGADDPLTTPIRIDTMTIDVVGIVGDARYGDVEHPAEPAVFFPHRDPRGVVFLRTSGDPVTLIAAVRGAIRRAGQGHATSDARTMDSRLYDATARNRLSLEVFTTFAISALLLATIGVYGTLALRVTLRARELAIRRALGASAASLAGVVANHTIGIALTGATLGIIGAALVARAMSSLLYDVRALDPAVYVGATLLLALAICAAAAVPTARTLRTDPREAMRAD